jgi:cysteine desulfurase/selenocysteine lyase
MTSNLASLLPGEAFRAELPLLARPDLIWLDHASTTPIAQGVIHAMTAYYTRDHGNVHRSIHRQGEAATAAYEGARARVARALGAADARCVVFTGGTTAALNLAAHGWGAARLGGGDRVLVSALEHHANLLPWQRIARAASATLTVLPLDPVTGVDPDSARREIARGAKILALTARSNVLGIAPPLAEICADARRHGVLTVVDAAQVVGHDAPDVMALGCDLLAFSGHKMYGPTGIGALVVHPERLAEGRPLLVGGGMVTRVTDNEAAFRPAPWGLEAGTPPIAQAVGLAAAFDLLERLDPTAAAAWESALATRLVEGLAARGDVAILGAHAPALRGGVVAFNLRGVHAHDVAEILGSGGVAVQAGHHCCQPLLERLGVDACVRASLGPANTSDDVDRLLAGLDRVREVFPR